MTDHVKGLVFSIQKFCLHDGPGIRTAVFLKGCPLGCKWCSNPESQFSEKQVLYDIRKCFVCGRCEAVCPNCAITWNGGHIRIDRALCQACSACVSDCPTGSLAIDADWMDVDKVIEFCLRDRDFYEESGGGVTLSGGEPMVQHGFTGALLEGLRAENIHTAIETTGCVSGDIFARIAPKADLLLFDVKHYEDDTHRLWTGAGSELILGNLGFAAQNSLNLLIRIPVIPQFNNTLEDAAGFVELFKSYGLHRVQLLPFHQFGENKYGLLGLHYAFEGVPPVQESDLTGYMNVFKNNDIDCFI